MNIYNTRSREAVPIFFNAWKNVNCKEHVSKGRESPKPSNLQEEKGRTEEEM